MNFYIKIAAEEKNLLQPVLKTEPPHASTKQVFYKAVIKKFASDFTPTLNINRQQITYNRYTLTLNKNFRITIDIWKPCMEIFL